MFTRELVKICGLYKAQCCDRKFTHFQN